MRREKLESQPESLPESHRAVRELFHDTARCLAADRCTKFLPVAFAQLTFIQSFAFAFYNVVRSAPISKELPSGRALNVEAFSIAYSVLFLWLIPVVYFGAIIGASQTEESIPRLLNSFRKQLLLMKDEVPREISDLLPREITLQSSLSRPETKPTPNHSVTECGNSVEEVEQGDDSCISVELLQRSQTAPEPGTPVLNTYRRISLGGLYSYNSSDSRKLSASLRQPSKLPERTTRQIRSYSFALVSMPVLISCLISGRVPPESFNCRHIGEVPTLFVWILSWGIGRFISSTVRDPRTQFWAKFVKEVIAGGVVITITLLTVIGILNRCDCYTMWGRRDFANPIYPDVAAKLKDRFRTEWPALVGVGIAVQLLACALLTWKYRTAARVYLQKDAL